MVEHAGDVRREQQRKRDRERLVQLPAAVPPAHGPLTTGTGSGIKPRYTTRKPNAALNSHPTIGCATRIRYIATYTTLAVAFSHAGISIGGARWVSRHISRRAVKAKTVTPAHSCQLYTRIF